MRLSLAFFAAISIMSPAWGQPLEDGVYLRRSGDNVSTHLVTVKRMSGGIFDSTTEKWIVRQYEDVDSESGLRLFGVVENGDDFLFLTSPDGGSVFYYEIDGDLFRTVNLLSITDEGIGVEVIVDDTPTEYEYLSPPPK